MLLLFCCQRCITKTVVNLIKVPSAKVPRGKRQNTCSLGLDCQGVFRLRITYLITKYECDEISSDFKSITYLFSIHITSSTHHSAPT